MKRIATPLRAGLLVVIIVGASVTAATWSLHSRAGDGSSKPEPSLAASYPDLVCIGYVDTEQRIRGLYPSQPGRVQEVLVGEDESVKAGTVLFRMDEQPAKFLLRLAQADLRVAERALTEAR